MIELLGMFIGGLVPTYVLSATMLWIMKTWQGGIRRLVFAHSVALLVASVIAGMGKADGGAFVPLLGLQMYIIPQLFWLAFDVFKLKRRQSKALNAAKG